MPVEDDDVARNASARLLTRDELRDAARPLWTGLRPGAVVWLSGEMGSGKTTFVQALCEVAGVSEVTSPTYALVQTYATTMGPVHHVDCYRLRVPAEALDLDLDALARAGRLTCIEWPERAGAFAPAPDLHLRFSHAEEPSHRWMDVAR